jgi:hypothetical protein
MACRNLTKRFIEIRSGAKANRSLTSGSGSPRESYEDGGLLKVRTSLWGHRMRVAGPCEWMRA